MHNPFIYPIAEAPTWLIDLVSKSKRDYDIDLSSKDQNIDCGKRNERLFEIAVVARNAGLKNVDTLFAHLSAVNKSNCKPPLPDMEVKRICESVISFQDKITERVNLSENEELIWDRTDKGKLRPTYRNALNFLKSDVKLHDILRYNEFSHRIQLQKPTFWAKKPKDLDDNDILQIKQYLTTHNCEPTFNSLYEAIQTIAYNNRYHPVKQWLETLSWDGKSRVQTFFSEYMGAECTPYSQYIGRLFFVSAVKRIYHPGCKFDYMVILEGKQGVGKSMALNTLGGQWFGEASLTDRDKDTVDKMQGLWIIEVAELEVFKKKEVESLKSFLSQQVDRVRLAYARTTKEFPRQSVFVGTINPDGMGYLKDTTGGRRFLPIAVNKIRVKQISADRDQLFAEALALMKQDDKIYIQEDMESDAVHEQELRLVVDVWENYIADWLKDPTKCQDNRLIQVSQVWTHALNGDLNRIDRAHQMRIASILRKFGYQNRVISSREKENYRAWVKDYDPITLQTQE